VLSKHFIDKADLDLNNIEFSMLQNDTVVQSGDSSDMIFTFDKIIAYISQFVTLKIGDLIYTGTPAGVGPVKIGDKLSGFIGTENMFNIEIR
jgi:2-keto-4-pentenoate hydratase/2-oxohepta-3-ene-1,7-dioic acid hydratase in catechol pathway